MPTTDVRRDLLEKKSPADLGEPVDTRPAGRELPVLIESVKRRDLNALCEALDSRYSPGCGSTQRWQKKRASRKSFGLAATRSARRLTRHLRIYEGDSLMYAARTATASPSSASVFRSSAVGIKDCPFVNPEGRAVVGPWLTAAK